MAVWIPAVQGDSLTHGCQQQGRPPLVAVGRFLLPWTGEFSGTHKLDDPPSLGSLLETRHRACSSSLRFGRAFLTELLQGLLDRCGYRLSDLTHDRLPWPGANNLRVSRPRFASRSTSCWLLLSSMKRSRWCKACCSRSVTSVGNCVRFASREEYPRQDMSFVEDGIMARKFYTICPRGASQPGRLEPKWPWALAIYTLPLHYTLLFSNTSLQHSPTIFPSTQHVSTALFSDTWTN